MTRLYYSALLLASSIFSSASFAAGSHNDCASLPSHAELQKVLLDSAAQQNGGFALPVWGAVLDRAGTVCAVAFTGDNMDSQWSEGRVTSVQKANTANAFSLSNLALSTANLYSPVQPGGSLYGLQKNNPVDVKLSRAGNPHDFGKAEDPMVGQRIGGISVLGGGLALYSKDGRILGAIGVSGDSSCADHNTAWRARHRLRLDYVPAGVSPKQTDAIIYDVSKGKSKGGFGHPDCGGQESAIAKRLPPVSKRAGVSVPAKTKI